MSRHEFRNGLKNLGMQLKDHEFEEVRMRATPLWRGLAHVRRAVAERPRPRDLCAAAKAVNLMSTVGSDTAMYRLP